MLVNLFSSSNDHADNLRRNCQNFQLEANIQGFVEFVDGEDRGLFRAVVKDICLMYENNPDFKKRCTEIGLLPEQTSMEQIVSKLRLVVVGVRNILDQNYLLIFMCIMLSPIKHPQIPPPTDIRTFKLPLQQVPILIYF